MKQKNLPIVLLILLSGFVVLFLLGDMLTSGKDALDDDTITTDSDADVTVDPNLDTEPQTIPAPP